MNNCPTFVVFFFFFFSQILLKEKWDSVSCYLRELTELYHRIETNENINQFNIVYIKNNGALTILREKMELWQYQKKLIVGIFSNNDKPYENAAIGKSIHQEHVQLV